MKMHVIEELAEFLSNQADAKISDNSKAQCALLVTDLIGAVGAGLNSVLAESAFTASRQIYGEGRSSVWLRNCKLSVAGAAMANSAAASALDIDDGHRGAAGHAGAGIIPATLAVAQFLDSDDESIFSAIALGYDIALRVATARPLKTIDTWASGRWVNYGVAAAAGRLLGLNSKAQAHAMAIAGAEGPIGFRAGSSKYQGSTVKEQIPPAVVAGLTAAFRAAAGATGPVDLLDDEHRFERSILLNGLGEHWWMADCYLKPYACCRYMHAAVDGIISLRKEGAPIRSLRIETFPRGLGLANERAPRTLEGAQYSYYFSCAVAALYGEAALQPLDPAKLKDPAVLALASRIQLDAHPDFAQAFPVSTPGRVILDQGNGPETITIAHPLGDVANPMSRAQVQQKFRGISRGNIDTELQEQLLSAADMLQAEGFQPLFGLLNRAC